VPVLLFYTSWCPVCTRARAWIAANHLNVSERNVDADPEAKRALHTLNPKGSIPTFVIDGRVYVGFAPSHIWQALTSAARRELDRAP
jgi:glutathione S-transferase